MQLDSIQPGGETHLSVLKRASAGSITYYTGNEPADVTHLRDCTLICRADFSPSLPGVVVIQCDNPQLEFYRLSHRFRQDYLEGSRLQLEPSSGARVHPDCAVGADVTLGPGSVIGRATLGDRVELHANVTVYAKSAIQAGTQVQAGSVIGAAGMMWTWDGREKVYLEQLGDVVIEEDCRIGAGVVIARGSANESTTVGRGSCIAHGSMIGHGCQIGEAVHIANGVSLGGSVKVAAGTFIGSGVSIRPGVTVHAEDALLGIGCVVTKDIHEAGTYFGAPARRVGPTRRFTPGVPEQRRS
jgi:UDP-3-O-[3-hydroxymyristoyl] glucosamine N-acyltransferase